MIFKKLIGMPDKIRKKYARKTLMIHTVVYLITAITGASGIALITKDIFQFSPKVMLVTAMVVFFMLMQLAALVISIQALKKERPWAWIAAIVATMFSLSIITLPLIIITIYLLIPSEYTREFEKEMISLFSNKKEQATPTAPLTSEKTD